ncbi:MAG: hypothetical protein LBS56_00440 [Propionibacteriaceae bacterium]|jgi:hypothetical protein|nr:hypothetical protein [Propionibacteriaceae bacterium]
MKIVDLLRRSDAEPPARRNAPLSPRGRAELRTLVGTAADRAGGGGSAARAGLPGRSGRRVQAISLGFTALAVVALGIAAAFRPWAVEPADRTAPPSVETPGPSATPSLDPAPTPRIDVTEVDLPTEAPSATPDLAGTPESAPTPTTPAATGGPGPATANGPATSAPPATSDAPRDSAPPVDDPPPQVETPTCSAEGCLLGTWRATYNSGYVVPDVFVIDATHVVFPVSCPQAGSTKYEATVGGVWVFSDNYWKDPTWTCFTDESDPRYFIGKVFYGLNQAGWWRMPDMNTIVFRDYHDFDQVTFTRV